MISVVKEQWITATVTGIRWERIYLTLTVQIVKHRNLESTEPYVFYAVDTENYTAEALFKSKQISEDTYEITVNVTNNGECVCVPTGLYSIYVCQGDKKLAECETSVQVVPFIDDSSRNFLYGNRKKSYTITFFVEEGGETLPFRMRTLAAKKTAMGFPGNKKLSTTIHPIKDIKACYLNHKTIIRGFYKFYRLTSKPRDKKTVLFMTEQNNVIASNLKAVSERMIERGLDKEFNLVYSARTASAESQSKKSWIELTKKMANSDIILLDDHAGIFDWMKLQDRTKVVQLWHAGAGFKSSGYSRWGHENCPSVQSCHRQYDLGIAGSRKIAHFFSEVWGINEEQVLPTGMPRMDEYLDEAHKESKIKEIYEQYPMCQGKKVILFGPTYRGKNKSEAYYPYELIDFDALYEFCKDEYVVLFKMHPWVNTDITIRPEHADKFVDVKKYPNINDLFYITDLLITDYSSNIFEYSLMRKPMLFFAFDKIQYSFSRGFHRPYEESAPGKVCYTFAELLTAMRNQDFEYEKVDQYVEHHFDYIDTHASDRVIDWIIRDQMPDDLRAPIKKVKEQMRIMRSLDFDPQTIGEVGGQKTKHDEEDEDEE